MAFRPLLAGILSSGGSSTQLINSQDETNYDGTGDNGTFVAGSAQGGAHEVGVTLTLENGATVLIDAVSGSPNARAITQFTITATGPAEAGVTYVETSNDSGGGTVNTPFSLTPGANNIE